MKIKRLEKNIKPYPTHLKRYDHLDQSESRIIFFQQTIERERLITEKTMLLQERDRILEERHALLSFAKGGEGATSELCRQLEQIISEKQSLGIENEKLRTENDELRKIKQQLIEERDAAQFR